MLRRLGGAALPGLVALGLLGPSSAQAAATVTVTTQNDAVANDGFCSLREAVNAANTNTPSSDTSGGCPAGLRGGTINVPDGTYALTGGELHITTPVTIAGTANHPTVVETGTDRVFEIDGSVTASISGLEIANGQARGGGGILNHGDLTLTDDVIDNNKTPDEPTTSTTGVSGGNGGGLDNEGTASLTRVRVEDNITGAGSGLLGSGVAVGGNGGAGGGIYNGGSLTLTDSQVTDNQTGHGGAAHIVAGTGGPGGGIANAGTLVANGDTIARNTTGNGEYSEGGVGAPGGDGGGVAAFGTVTITNSAITANHTGITNLLSGVSPAPAGAGAGIGSDDLYGAPAPLASLTITNTTIADNTRGSDQGANGAGVGDGIHVRAIGSPTVSITNSAVTGSGGIGVAAWSDGAPGTPRSSPQVSLRNVTVADSVGGGVYAKTWDGGTDPSGASTPLLTLELVSTTIAANGGPAVQSAAEGSNPTPAPPVVTAKDSVFDANLSCSGTITDGGHNVSWQNTACPGVPADPKLGTLGLHGGPTQTLPLLPGSAAVDAIPPSNPSCNGTDQRGVPRPVGGGCDIGAYEVAAPGISSSVASVTGATTARVTAQITPYETPASVTVQFGRTSAYGSTVKGPTVAAGTGATPVSIPLGGLTPGTTYHAQLVAVNEDGTTHTQDLTFTTSHPQTPPPPPAATPRLTALSISPGAFRAASGRGGSIARARPTGATVRYSDSKAATTTFTVQHVLNGHRNAQGKCSTKPVRKGSHAKKCTLTVNLRGSFTHRDNVGKNSFHFTGRLRGTRLPPGSYRLVAVARLSGKTSRAISHGFSIVR